MKRILIVDDEDLIRHSLSAALRQDDTLVKAVSCGNDALGEIEAIFYDLCFLDVNLPDIHGLDLMKTIKRSSPATKIVIMTAGVVDEPELVQSIQANANLFLSKPFDLDRVKLFVNGTIGQDMSRLQADDHSSVLSGNETRGNRERYVKRQCERQTIVLSTACSVIASDSGQGEKRFTAGILEISESGMCIRTEYPLKPGQILRFGHNPELSAGVVRWSNGGGAGESFCAGIQFAMQEDPSNQSVLQAQVGGDG